MDDICCFQFLIQLMLLFFNFLSPYLHTLDLQQLGKAMVILLHQLGAGASGRNWFESLVLLLETASASASACAKN